MIRIATVDFSLSIIIAGAVDGNVMENLISGLKLLRENVSQSVQKMGESVSEVNIAACGKLINFDYQTVCRGIILESYWKSVFYSKGCDSTSNSCLYGPGVAITRPPPPTTRPPLQRLKPCHRDSDCVVMGEFCSQRYG